MLVALSLLVAVFAAASFWLWHRGKLDLSYWGATALVVASLVGTGLKVHFDRSSAARDMVASASPESTPLAWPSSRAFRATQPGGDTSAASSPTHVAPVDSLIGGLEERLAKEPNDAKGWALLAQSYSFVGDAAGAQRAADKAVALGFDEQSLREKVSGAARGPH